MRLLNGVLIVLTILAVSSCTDRKSTINNDNNILNQRGTKKETEKQNIWNKANLVISVDNIVNIYWDAGPEDMGEGSKLIRWTYYFKNNGEVTLDVATKEWATGPILLYKIDNSILYENDWKTKGWHKRGEIRILDNILMLKDYEGKMFRFHKLKDRVNGRTDR